MRLLPPPFRDDLGRRVPAAVVTKEVLRAVDADWKRRRALTGLRQERWRGGFLMGMVLGLLYVGAMLLVNAWNVLPSLPREVTLMAAMVAVALALRPLRPWLLERERPSRPKRTRQRFLAALLCPACAHDLKGTPARGDGVTVCPECGAAWKLEGTQAGSHEGAEGK